MKTTKLLCLFLALFFTACHPSQKTSTGGDDGVIEIVFLQLNDVYEISPLGDNKGGLARVAELRRQLKAKNPNTFTVLAGDFISPSVIGTLKYDGKRIRGRQMVDVFNTLGMDWVVFGNHEFDYDLADLQARLDESNFTWLGANARLKTEKGLQPFFKNKPDGTTEICPDHLVRPVKDADGTTINLGVFGVLINSGRKPWVEYSDWEAAAKQQYELLKGLTDVCVALTHLDYKDDIKLAGMLPAVPLWMGGHDHDNMLHRVGESRVTKADANARTVYVHTLRYDKNKRKSTVESKLVTIDASLPEDPQTAAVVAKWEKIKNESLASAGFDPAKLVTELKAPLDCREAAVRNIAPLPVGDMITAAMMKAARRQPQCAVLNGGSIRVDDVLTGNLFEIDIVRMLPFGGTLVEADMRGSLLRRMLDQGEQNRGNGGFLHLNGVKKEDGKWMLGKQTLDDNAVYRVILPEFLFTGNENNMAFLKAAPNADGKGTSNPDVLAIYKADPADAGDLRNDVRHALIAYLREKKN